MFLNLVCEGGKVLFTMHFLDLSPSKHPLLAIAMPAGLVWRRCKRCQMVQPCVTQMHRCNVAAVAGLVPLWVLRMMERRERR